MTRSSPPFKQIGRPKAILFDNDGVLIASEPLHMAAWEKLLPELGLPYHPPDIQVYVGKTAPLTLAGVLDRYRPGWSPSDFDVEALSRRKNDYYLDLARQKLSASPGVLDGLKWLKAQEIKSAVVTNAKRREMEASLKLIGTWDLLDEKISRDEVPAPKPDPTGYMMAAASLGFDPGECVAIEDSPPGLEAALLAGTQACAVTTTFPRAYLESPIPGRPDLRPVWIGASMMEFFEWVKNLKH